MTIDISWIDENTATTSGASSYAAESTYADSAGNYAAESAYADSAGNYGYQSTFADSAGNYGYESTFADSAGNYGYESVFVGSSFQSDTDTGSADTYASEDAGATESAWEVTGADEPVDYVYDYAYQEVELLDA